MWIALIMATGVIGGVSWLAATVPPCMRCARRGRCERVDRCPGRPVGKTIQWSLPDK